MNHAMANRDQVDFLRLAQPCPGSPQRGWNVVHAVRGVGLVDQLFVFAAFDAQPRPRADAVHLPFEQALWLIIPINAKYLKLDARRTGIDDQDRVHRFRPPA